MSIYDMTHWAISTFSRAKLGDPRRMQRLVELAVAMATAPHDSLPTALGGARKDLDAAYDLLASEHFDSSQLLQAPLEHTLARMSAQDPQERFVLACDTTELHWSHAGVREVLGQIGAHRSTRGLLAHEVLVLRASDAVPLGLLALDFWERDPALYGKKHERKQRPYEHKESFKWQRALGPVLAKLDASLLSRCHVVCDREADVSELLSWLCAQEVGFVIRSCYDRRLEEHPLKLRAHLESAPVSGRAQVRVAQRGGRPGRLAKVETRFSRVVLRAPKRWGKGVAKAQAVEVGVVQVSEEAQSGEGQAEPLHWVLLSNLKAESGFEALEQTRRVYESRWACEEFHRCWKSEVGVEKSRVQTRQGLEKVACLKAAIAVRLMEMQKWKGRQDQSCEEVGLEELEWKLLWSLSEEDEVPTQVPSAAWAYEAVARLGGWSDTKRTGRAGPKALRQGLEKLQWLKLGAQYARSQLEDDSIAESETFD